MATKKQKAGAVPQASAAPVSVQTSALSIFDRFKAISEVKPVAITCKGWGAVFVLPMTVAETQIAQEADGEPTKNHLAKAVIHLMCDGDGKRVFDIANPEHLALVQAQHQDSLVDFLKKAGRALGTTEEGAAAAKKG
jgi:hypothetical protein